MRAVALVMLLVATALLVVWEVFTPSPALMPFWLGFFVLAGGILHFSDQREKRKVEAERDGRWTLKELVELPERHPPPPVVEWDWPAWRSWPR